MGALIRNAYADNVPNKVFINTSYDIIITVNIDDIFTTDNKTYVVQIVDQNGFVMAKQEIKNHLGQGEDQQQWKFNITLWKHSLGFKLVKVFVELSELKKPSMTENWIDTDTVAFMTEGINLLLPLPEFPLFPFIQEGEKDTTKGKAAFWIVTPSILTLLTLFKRRRRD